MRRVAIVLFVCVCACAAPASTNEPPGADVGDSRCDEAVRGRDAACNMSKQLCQLGAESAASVNRCEQGRTKCAAMQARADEICNPAVSAPRRK